ncbi:MAG: hypothetical protein QXS59_08015 [Metallosphaera sp.]
MWRGRFLKVVTLTLSPFVKAEVENSELDSVRRLSRMRGRWTLAKFYGDKA